MPVTNIESAIGKQLPIGQMLIVTDVHGTIEYSLDGPLRSIRRLVGGR